MGRDVAPEVPLEAHQVQEQQRPESDAGKGAIVKQKKRKVVRRDPEKRRLQNLQAQKKYRELRLLTQVLKYLLCTSTQA